MLEHCESCSVLVVCDSLRLLAPSMPVDTQHKKAIKFSSIYSALTKLFLLSYLLVGSHPSMCDEGLWQPDCMSFIHVCSVRDLVTATYVLQQLHESG